jgi:carboxyl-terminal processing protease
MKSRSLAWALILSLTMTIFFTPLAMAAGSSTSNAATGDYLEALMKMAQKEYNYEITDQVLVEGAVKGIFDSMDDWTVFYNNEEAKQFLETVGGAYTGIGIALSQMDNYVVVTRVFASSPAETAGILEGDKIATINSKNVIGVSVDEVSSLIRGEVGSQVTVGIIRDKIPHNFTVTRRAISINPISYEIRDGIAYISIDTFNANTYDKLAVALEAVDAAGVKRVILDLRNNGGGEVEQAIAVAQRLVPEGIISSLHFRNTELTDTIYRSNLKTSPYKLVVLVNEMTASASEILAGAIQDTQTGKLVGSKTFGKARVQSIIPVLSPEGYQKYGQQDGLVDAYALERSQQLNLTDNDILGWVKITTGTYTTPAGRMIDGQGLTPDETVADPEPKNEVYINSVVKLSQTVKHGLNDEGLDVYNAEKILRLIGYDIDAPDMKLDSKTFAAIQKFQLEHGLYSYGVLDFTTQKSLNQQYDKVLPQVDRQYGRALEILQSN